MASFSPPEAAVEGFRQTWERPRAALLWGGVMFLVGLAANIVFIASGGAQAARAIVAAGDASGLTPQAASTLMAHAAPAFALACLIYLVRYAVVNAAVLRAVLTPGVRRFGGLRLSKDEVLQFILAVIVLALVLGYVFAATVLFSLASLVSTPLSALLRPFLAAGSIAGLFAILIRLSLAPAATFTAGRLRLFAAAPMTRGAFWPIASTYLLSSLLTAIVTLLAAVIFFLVVMAIGLAQGGVAGLRDAVMFARSAPQTLPELLAPRDLIDLAFDSALSTLAYILMMAPGAVMFRALSGARPPEPAAKVAPGAPWG